MGLQEPNPTAKNNCGYQWIPQPQPSPGNASLIRASTLELLHPIRGTCVARINHMPTLGLGRKEGAGTTFQLYTWLTWKLSGWEWKPSCISINFFLHKFQKDVYHRNAGVTFTAGEQNVAPLLKILSKDLHDTELLYIANFKIKKIKLRGNQMI